MCSAILGQAGGGPVKPPCRILDHSIAHPEVVEGPLTEGRVRLHPIGRFEQIGPNVAAGEVVDGQAHCDGQHLLRIGYGHAADERPHPASARFDADFEGRIRPITDADELIFERLLDNHVVPPETSVHLTSEPSAAHYPAKEKEYRPVS